MYALSQLSSTIVLYYDSEHHAVHIINWATTWVFFFNTLPQHTHISLYMSIYCTQSPQFTKSCKFGSWLNFMNQSLLDLEQINCILILKLIRDGKSSRIDCNIPYTVCVKSVDRIHSNCNSFTQTYAYTSKSSLQ